jgi:DNA replication regulator SLD3
MLVDDTPIKSRLPLALAQDGGNRSSTHLHYNLNNNINNKAKEVDRGVDGGGSGSDDGEKRGGENGNIEDGMSIYQRLGWETTDLDDIDDLL